MQGNKNLIVLGAAIAVAVLVILIAVFSSVKDLMTVWYW